MNNLTEVILRIIAAAIVALLSPFVVLSVVTVAAAMTTLIMIRAIYFVLFEID